VESERRNYEYSVHGSNYDGQGGEKVLCVAAANSHITQVGDVVVVVLPTRPTMAVTVAAQRAAHTRPGPCHVTAGQSGLVRAAPSAAGDASHKERR